MAAALVLARSAAAAELRPLLGDDAHRRLVAALRERARAWAEAVAPGRARVADDPADARAEVEAALEEHGGPLLVAGIAVPRLSAGHAAAALADLRAGADATFGPGMDGGWYLVGLSARSPALLDLAAEVFAGPDVMPRTLAAAQDLGLDVGLLRMERVLATALDGLAMAADPLTPPEVAALLAPLRER